MSRQLDRLRKPLADARRRRVFRRLSARLAGLAASPAGPVVLLLDEQTAREPAGWTDQFGEDRLHVVAPPGSAVWPGVAWVGLTARKDVEAYLASIGACSVILDEVAAEPGKQLERWMRFGFHLRVGGWYAVRATVTPGRWGELLAALGDPLASVALAEFGASSREARVAEGHLLLPNQRQHLLKVGELDAPAALKGREAALRIESLATRESVAVRSPLKAFSHGSEVVSLPKPSFEAPTLNCRWYQGPVQVRSHLLTISGDTVLPPSFRHAWAERPRNPRLVEVSRRFAEFEPAEPAIPLNGDYFDLNAAVPGHFGHVMTESIAKLWAWDEARTRLPGIRGLYRLPPGASQPTFERTLFEAFGLNSEDVVWATNDLALTSYVAPTLPWHNGRPHHFHPVVKDVWARVREALARAKAGSAERLFVSRGLGGRACRNQPEVEAWFTRRGFEVVYPERLSMDDQATLFSNARVVAGFAGSAMFNVLFAEHLDMMIVLSHEQYTARNEWLFGAALADELHYFWSKPDQQTGPGVEWRKAFHSTWAFDLDRFGVELDAALS